MSEAREPNVSVTLSIRWVVRVLITLIVAFGLVSLAAQLFSENVIADNQYVDRIADWLNVNSEGSIPTWYASITLMSCAVLLAIIAIWARRAGRPFGLHWATLSIAFALLSLEEIIGVHSQAFKVLRTAASGISGAGYALILGGLLVAGLIVLAWLYGRFFLHLPSRWRTLVLVGMAIYLTGVFGTDAIGDSLRTVFGEDDIVLLLVLTLEEVLEMSGVLIFIYCLLDYIRRFVGDISIGVREPLRANAAD